MTWQLSSLIAGRDNNLNLLRFLAATAVLVTHSYALTTGQPAAEPLRATLGVTWGSIAVDVFFITSGYLVTASLLRSRNWVEFVLARVLRIYPALWVMLVLTVFGMGMALTDLPWSAYLSSKQVYVYLARCGSLLGDMAYLLPGVFERNPYPGAVNGSLWTLPLEVRMYALLLAAWVVCRAVPRSGSKAFAGATILACGLSGIHVGLAQLNSHGATPWIALLFMFSTGAVIYHLRDRVVISAPVFVVALVSVLIATTFSRNAFFWVYHTCIGYLVICFSYLPWRAIRSFNKLGDYSYGIYIYAYPVQQTIADLWPGVGLAGMLCGSLAGTLLLAALSWHGVERRALALKGDVLAHTRQWWSDRGH